MSRLSFLRSLLLGYALAIAAITLTPRPAPVAPDAVDSGGLSNFVGNIALFVPLGLLVPLIWPHLRSIRAIVFIGAGCSITIELLQLAIPGRSASVHDVALNTVGALTGAVLFLEILDHRGR